MGICCCLAANSESSWQNILIWPLLYEHSPCQAHLPRQGSKLRVPTSGPSGPLSICQPSVLVTRAWGAPALNVPSSPWPALGMISRYIIPATSQRCYLPSGAGQAFPMNVLSIKKHTFLQTRIVYIWKISCLGKKIHKIKLLVFPKQNTSVFFWNGVLVFEVRTIFIYRKNLKELKTWIQQNFLWAT